MWKKIANFVVSHPKITIILSCVLTIALSIGIPRLYIDDDITKLMPKNMPSRQNLDKIESVFGGSDVLLIGIGNEKETIMNPKTLAKIKTISDELKAMKGVRDVMSISSVKRIESSAGELMVSDLMPSAPKTTNELATLKQRLLAEPDYLGHIVSKDMKHAAIIVSFKEKSNDPVRYRNIQQLVEKYRGSDTIVMGGNDVLKNEIVINVKRDLFVLLPFVIVVMGVILFLSLRTVSGVWLPLATVGLATASTVGLMGLLGRPFTVLNAVLPIILIAMRAAHVIMIMARYYELCNAIEDEKTAIIKATEDISLPIVMSGVAMIIGFISFLTSPLPVQGEFGLFAAFGVLISLIFTITFVPAVLVLLPKHKDAMKSQNADHAGFVNRALARVSAVVTAHPVAVIVTGTVLTIALAAGIPFLHTDSNIITWFSKDSTVRKADVVIDKNLGGSMTMNLLVEGDMQDPSVLRSMEDIQRHLESYPEVTSTISIASIVKKINKAMNDNDPHFEVLPQTRTAVAQSLLLYGMSGDPKDFEQYINNDNTRGQILVQLKNVNSARLMHLTDNIRRYLAKCRAASSDAPVVLLSGTAIIMSELSGMIVGGIWSSTIVTLILIFMIMLLTYRSLPLSIFGMIPLIMTVLITFGLMGIAHIPIGIPSVIISGIVIGAGIDYSFYFVSRYLSEVAAGRNGAVARTISTVGKPLLFNAFAIAFGFLVLIFSSFIPIQNLGEMIAVAMLVCGCGVVTILAAVLTVTQGTLFATESTAVKGGILLEKASSVPVEFEK